MKNATMLSCFPPLFLILQCFCRKLFVSTTRNKKHWSNHSWLKPEPKVARCFPLSGNVAQEIRLLLALLPTCCVTLRWASGSAMLSLGLEWALTGREGRGFLGVMSKWLFLFCTTSNLKRFHRASRIWWGSFKETSEPVVQWCWSCPQRSCSTSDLSTDVCNTCSGGTGKFEFYMSTIIFTALGLWVHVWFHRKNCLLHKRYT